MGKTKQNIYDRICQRLSDYYFANRKLADIFFVVLLFSILFFVRVNNINIKNQLHSDEVFSLMLSTCNHYYNQPVPDGVYSGEELKKMITVDDGGGLKGAVDDIARLWKNNGDAPHASLYYMALRLTLIGFDEFNVHEFAWRGGILNILFFSLSFFFMYKLLRKIFQSDILLVLAGLAIAFGNWMSIKNTLLIREYQMAETGIILLTLICVMLVQSIRERKPISTGRFVVSLSLAIAYVISLGYFNAVYVIVLGFGIIAACLKYKNSRLILSLVIAGIFAVLVAWLLYTGFFNFLLHDSVHRERAFSSMKNMFRYVFIRDIIFQFFTVYGAFIMAFVLLIVIFSKNRNSLVKSDSFHWLPVVVVICMIFIQYASVLKMPRYYYALVPILALCAPQVIACVPKSWKGYFELLVILYFPIICVMFPVRENYGWVTLKSNLSEPAVLYDLNPNEVVQLVPCMNDSIEYEISGKEYVDIKKDTTTFIITKHSMSINNDSIKSAKKMIWGKQIYLYKFDYVSDENNS